MDPETTGTMFEDAELPSLYPADQRLGSSQVIVRVRGILPGEESLNQGQSLLGDQGAPWMSEEWKAEYQPSRATIESRNDLLKNARGAGIGDSTSRLMRGWAAQLFFSAVGVVTVNVRLIQAWLAKPSGTVNPPPRPPGGGEKLESFSLREVADSNAPPMAA